MTGMRVAGFPPPRARTPLAACRENPFKSDSRALAIGLAAATAPATATAPESASAAATRAASVGAASGVHRMAGTNCCGRGGKKIAAAYQTQQAVGSAQTTQEATAELQAIHACM